MIYADLIRDGEEYISGYYCEEMIYAGKRVKTTELSSVAGYFANWAAEQVMEDLQDDQLKMLLIADDGLLNRLTINTQYASTPTLAIRASIKTLLVQELRAKTLGYWEGY